MIDVGLGFHDTSYSKVKENHHEFYLAKVIRFLKRKEKYREVFGVCLPFILEDILRI